MKKLGQLAKPYRVDDGKQFRLRDFDPGDTGKLKSKEHAAVELQRGVDQLSEWQDKLYAQHQWAVLLIFQAMDAARQGRHHQARYVGCEPRRLRGFSFKAPSGLESSHDYLWRATLRLPECGRIGIFNRSYYEEVLVVRVHQLLKQSKIPPSSG